ASRIWSRRTRRSSSESRPRARACRIYSRDSRSWKSRRVKRPGVALGAGGAGAGAGAGAALRSAVRAVHRERWGEQGRPGEHQEARRQGHDRRRGIHRPIRPAARIHARGRGVRRPGVEESALPRTHRRDAQGRHSRSAGHHERAVPGQEGRTGGRGAARGAGRRSHQAPAAWQAKGRGRPDVGKNTRSASRGVVLEIDPMANWLAILSALAAGGVAAGLAFYGAGRRVERRVAEAAARAAAAESERLLADARQRVVLAAKEELIQAREAFEEDLTP